MKIACFRAGKRQMLGLVEGDDVTPFDLSPARTALGLGAILGETVPGLQAGKSFRMGEIELLAPIPRPRRNIFCVGKNYFDHAHEFARSGFDSSASVSTVPKEPIIFSKVPESVIAHRQPILIDAAVSEAVDYEAELAVIIGKGGRGIPKSQALAHVWGYTIVNDVTARDLQGRYSQWLVGKSQDTFCPMGPVAVSRDELDLGNTAIRCSVNGELRQNSNTSLLIFDVPTIIATISAGLSLIPGDIIATGTPAGVGIGFKPPRYLKPGDRVRIELDGIGVLENPVAAMP